MALLEVKDLSIDYLTETNAALHAVEGVSFHLEGGRSLGIVGESGCGKTTVMLGLLRLLPEEGRITRGRILFDGQDLLQLTEAEMRRVRWRGISYVFQGAMNALNPVRTITDQIREAILLHGVAASRRAADRRTGELLELVGIPASRGAQYPHQYSGGMRQRAVIAMALACDPKILVADEPTTALDVMIQAQILDLLDHLKADMNLALILVSHDLGLVTELCDDVLVMYGGMMAEHANSDTLFNSPLHPYTQRLLKAFPDVEHPTGALASIAGSPPRLDDLPPGCRFEPRCHRREGICVTQPPLPICISAGHECACYFAGVNR